MEEEADELFITSLRTLHTTCSDPLEVIVWREIYTYLEKCVDACEHVADIGGERCYEKLLREKGEERARPRRRGALRTMSHCFLFEAAVPRAADHPGLCRGDPDRRRASDAARLRQARGGGGVHRRAVHLHQRRVRHGPHRHRRLRPLHRLWPGGGGGADPGRRPGRHIGGRGPDPGRRAGGSASRGACW